MTIRTEKQLNLAYAQLPFKRNQDLVKIIPAQGDYQYIVCLVDGWNELSLNSDIPGRKVANVVFRMFSQYFLSSKIRDIQKRAEEAAQRTDAQIMRKFSMCATSVAAFLFHGDKQDIVIAVGDPEAYLWNGKTWYKPKEISDHILNPPVEGSNASRFFGCPQRKINPLFSAKPDVVAIPSNASVILATDGIKDVLSISDINVIVGNPYTQSPKTIIEKLFAEIRRRKIQKDDISILLRIPPSIPT